jgi:hypothetical protein
VAVRIALVLVVLARIAAAQPGIDPAATLRDANTAATQGEWDRVSQTVEPLLAQSLEPADLAEAHRLAGLAAYFHGNKPLAESHFLAYLRLDLQGHLDPALYPPEVTSFFDDVRVRHAAELRARAPHAKRRWYLTLVPYAAQEQNGDRTKGIVLASLVGAFAITNVTTYFVLRSWCHDQGSTCDASGTNHFHAAQRLQTVNVVAGLGLIATYLYGVYDGVSGYRRRDREQSFAPYATSTNTGAVFGITGSF